MRCKMLFGVIVALLLALTAVPISAQAKYAALAQARPNLSFGGGYSFWNPDWGGGHSTGYTATVDWHPRFFPILLNDVKIEGEMRGLVFHLGNNGSGNSVLPTLYTAGGGLLYAPHTLRFFGFSPFAKGLYSWGSVSWYSLRGGYNPTSSSDYAVPEVGAGVERPLTRSITARAEWDYEWYPNFCWVGGGAQSCAQMDGVGGPTLEPNGSYHDLNPHGFTFGAMYSFGRW